MGLNKVILMGRITKDIELRKTMGGTPVTTFTVAVDRDYTPKGEEKQTDFIEVVAWRNTAEFISRFFGKGRMIIVEGSLQSRKWTDKNGNNRVSWEVQASNVYFGDSKRDTCNTYDERETTTPPQFAEVEEDGTLPF